MKTLLHALVGVVLGILILEGWPTSTAWVIGTLVAVDLLVNGVRLVSLGLAARPRGHRAARPVGV